MVESTESCSLEEEAVEENFEGVDPSSTSPQLLASNMSMFTVVTLYESLRQEASSPSLTCVHRLDRLEKLVNLLEKFAIF